jgi:enoyl-[acyl-carrier protein] reductase I
MSVSTRCVSSDIDRPVGLMAGKRGVIMGVANDHSLGWGIADVCVAHGADLAFTYQGESVARRVRSLAESVGSDFLVACDVGDEGSIDAAFRSIAARWNQIDFLVHAIAFADKANLRGRYVDTPREAFLQAMDISCYSLLAITQRALPLMRAGGSILTLTYYGAEKWVPNYNVMGVAKAALEASVRYMAADLGAAGIRVNAISAGPVKTLAASGIDGFQDILRWNRLNSPLRRNVSLEELGGASVYLLSDLSSGVTGEIHHVDCGYHVIGMKHTSVQDAGIEQG